MSNKIIVLIVSTIIGLTIGFFFDAKLVDFVMSTIPSSVSEWFGIIRIAVWVFVLWLTFGFIVVFSYIFGLIASEILG
jgi:uncharacterized protein involved in cysteine biosynthesis